MPPCGELKIIARLDSAGEAGEIFTADRCRRGSPERVGA
jgi:hypothetical protein